MLFLFLHCQENWSIGRKGRVMLEHVQVLCSQIGQKSVLERVLLTPWDMQKLLLLNLEVGMVGLPFHINPLPLTFWWLWLWSHPRLSLLSLLKSNVCVFHSVAGKLIYKPYIFSRFFEDSSRHFDSEALQSAVATLTCSLPSLHEFSLDCVVSPREWAPPLLLTVWLSHCLKQSSF